MAERRMFAKTIIDSDAFLDMPTSTRLLYYDLGMRADDDGFVNSPKQLIRSTGASQDDLKLLIAKKFIIPFESGVVVIKHWKIHNYIRSDRYSETNYKEEKAMLKLDENKSYKFDGMTNGIPTVDVGKVRIGKDSIDKDRDIYSREVHDIVSYLNQKTNSSYKHTTKKTQNLIKARLNENFTIEDFKTVIDIKTKQWLNDSNMSKYLRPETLFGTKFESYLNEGAKNGINRANNQQEQTESERVQELIRHIGTDNTETEYEF